MNKNVMIVLAGGFFVAILVAVLVNASLNGSESAAPTGEPTETEILVAAKDLRIGKDVGSGDVEWQAWPDDAMFSGAIKRADEEEKAEDAVKGRLNVSLTEGQPMLRGYLVEEESNNFMAATLGQGMRAVGVSVKAETMAGGFIGPGDYVDVLLTYKVKVRDRDNAQVAATIESFATETLLERVRVLAVDQKSTRDEDKAKVARTVTLEVDAAGAEKLALASEMGDITLALRSLGDDKYVADQNVTTDVKVSRIMQKLSKMQNSSGGASGIVRVYNGEEVVNVPVRQTVQDIE